MTANHSDSIVGLWSFDKQSVCPRGIGKIDLGIWLEQPCSVTGLGSSWSESPVMNNIPSNTPDGTIEPD